MNKVLLALVLSSSLGAMETPKSILKKPQHTQAVFDLADKHVAIKTPQEEKKELLKLKREVKRAARKVKLQRFKEKVKAIVAALFPPVLKLVLACVKNQ